MEPMTVVFHYDSGDWLRGEIAALSAQGLAVDICPAEDDERFARLMRQAEVLWHVLRPLTAADIAAAPRLRLVQKIGVGVNTIDLDACRARGIAVCNMPGTNTRAVAEVTLGLMLAVMRRLVSFDAGLRDGGRWHWPVARQGLMGEIAGSRVGLVGMGAVPRALAPILQAMGAEVVYTGRRPAADVPWPYLDKQRLLSSSDIVSLHIPQTPQTVRWLDRQAIAGMKPGAVLINTARGGLVDEPALVEALCQGHLAGAGLDVFAEEPVAPDNPLLSLENVVLAPHVAWFTRGTLKRSLSVAAENCRRLRVGEALLHRLV